MSRVVVTGGAGFIGSHLCERLLARGDEVVCIDDFSSGRRDNVAAIVDAPGFTLVEADVSGGLGYEDAFDGIFHLASPASPPDYLRRPLETMAVNAEGTRHVLEAATRHGARMLLASTSEVYGDPLEHPQHEDYTGNVNPVGPRAVYDESKRFAEAMTAAYGRELGTDVCVARIFNTYGPRMRRDDGRVVSNFICQALDGAELTVQGDGSQTRSFCFVDDLVEGLLRLFDSSHAGPVNLGSTDELTVCELAEIVLELTGSSSRVVTRPLPTDDPKLRRPDLTRAGELLDWEPTVDVRDGLTRTVEHFRSTAAT